MKKMIMGVTGVLGSGKSTFSKAMQQWWSKGVLQVIEVDDVRREVLWKSVEPRHCLLRQQLATEFGLKVNTSHCWLHRQEFTQAIFTNKHTLERYGAIATPVLKEMISHQLHTHAGDSVVVWAYLLEEGYTSLLNSAVFMTWCNSQIILQRLLNEEDSLSKDMLLQRIQLCTTHEEKMRLAHQCGVKPVRVNTEEIIEEKTIEMLQRVLGSIGTMPEVKNHESII